MPADDEDSAAEVSAPASKESAQAPEEDDDILGIDI